MSSQESSPKPEGRRLSNTPGPGLAVDDDDAAVLGMMLFSSANCKG